jgi:hypothetical protein
MKLYKWQGSKLIKMNYIKIFLTLLIVYYQKLNTLNADNITVIENCVFNQPMFINNICRINNININGQIGFGNINELQNIKIYITTETGQLTINNLPILSDTTPINKRMLIGIDDKNALYLYQEKNNTIAIKPQATDDLNAINIDTFDINQLDNSLPLISSINQDGLPVDLWFGNSNNNVIFLSPVLFNVNSLSFNDSINYPIILSSNTGATINGNLTTGELLINKNLITNSDVSMQFENIFINGDLNINSNNTVLVQGDIVFNDTLSLGNLSTNLTIYSNEKENVSNLFFLGTDSNQNLCATSIAPALATLNSEQIISENNNLIILAKNNNLQIGNLTSDIIFDCDSLLLENSWQLASNKNSINFIFNTKNTFQSQTIINSLDNAFSVVSNDMLSIDGDIKFNAITFNKDIYFPNIPTINNFSSYVVISYENNIGYLQIESIANSLKKIKTIQKKFYNASEKLYSDLRSIENILEKNKMIYVALENTAMQLTKKNKHHIKKLINHLKKNQADIDNKHKKLLQALEKEL